uniref:Uncharacterized protein n=1 Tax=Anopheles farauti TaxID=69004 RepID=A0A182Q854_9DIPT
MDHRRTSYGQHTDATPGGLGGQHQSVDVFALCAFTLLASFVSSRSHALGTDVPVVLAGNDSTKHTALSVGSSAAPGNGAIADGDVFTLLLNYYCLRCSQLWQMVLIAPTLDDPLPAAFPSLGFGFRIFEESAEIIVEISAHPPTATTSASKDTEPAASGVLMGKVLRTIDVCTVVEAIISPVGRSATGPDTSNDRRFVVIVLVVVSVVVVLVSARVLCRCRYILLMFLGRFLLCPNQVRGKPARLGETVQQYETTLFGDACTSESIERRTVDFAPVTQSSNPTNPKTPPGEELSPPSSCPWLIGRRVPYDEG